MRTSDKLVKRLWRINDQGVSLSKERTAEALATGDGRSLLRNYCVTRDAVRLNHEHGLPILPNCGA